MISFLNYLFFYSYIGLVLLAGAWGAFAQPALEFRHLLDMDLTLLDDQARVNLLSQYRFLRALEVGFGLFGIWFLKEIFTIRKFNLLFLLIMGSGILARITSWCMDGQANNWALFFLFYEAVGWIVITAFSVQKGIYNVG